MGDYQSVKRWRKKYPEKRKAQSKRYYKKHKKEMNEKSAIYYRENRKESLARGKRWRDSVKNTPEFIEKQARQYKEYRIKNKEYIAKLRVAQRLRIRAACFAHYGNSCACCGESEKQFLSFDHIDNNGGEHRKRETKAKALPQWLRANGFPDGFQVLCRNCNWGKYINKGVCPHKSV